MTVEQRETIDYLGANPSAGTVTLFLIEARPWTASAEQMQQLNDKLVTYRAFVTEGKLAKGWPALAGMPVTIEVRCAGEPPVAVMAHLNHWGQRLLEDGIALDVSIPPPGHTGGVILPESPS